VEPSRPDRPVDPQLITVAIDGSRRPVSNRGAFDQAMASLSPSQRAAVDADSPELCIVAGAGAGKTRVLTLRAARRIQDGRADADHLAVCTFTRKAATELRERLRLYGVPVATSAPRGGVPGPGVRAGTIHQLALTLIRRHATDHGRPPPVVSEDRFRILADIVGEPSLASAVNTEVGWAKARCLSAQTYVDAAASAGRPAVLSVEQVVDAFDSYQRALARREAIDFDDVLIDAGDLLETDPGFAEAVSWRYRHLCVDEFQDVNPAQFRLMRLIAGSSPDICVVGDPNQAIYGWNGADPTLLDRLPDLFPDMKEVRLEDNHRSTPQIVAAASAALGPMRRGLLRSVAPDGPRPVVTTYDHDVAEAEGVVSSLLERATDGLRWSDQAVLARTHDQLAVVRETLSRAGIPFRLATSRETPADDRTGDAVELATFHRAKGLEWTSVSVVGLEDGYSPIVYAESHEALAEERRLLYVALTRATNDLHCSWARSRTMGGRSRVERRPSPWLAAIARECRTGTGRAGPIRAGQRIAVLRAALEA
jgi:DNA helicase II / ATP-dependent DNA helicase PcrA